MNMNDRRAHGSIVDRTRTNTNYALGKIGNSKWRINSR